MYNSKIVIVSVSILNERFFKNQVLISLRMLFCIVYANASNTFWYICGHTCVGNFNFAVTMTSVLSTSMSVTATSMSSTL